MIQKFTNIKDFAVFKDFCWDKSVCDSNGCVLNLQKNNIIFGHNYSGKTTLSRIVRALEKKELPPKYDNPKFLLKINDTDIHESELEKCKDTVRVFNEDFVRDNLAFITNPEASIEPFAIVGESNVEIINKIKSVLDELGDNGREDGHTKTKLYKEQEEKKTNFDNANNTYADAKQLLDNKLYNKAVGDRTHSIKYQSDLFGDISYNTAKLNNEIEVVRSSEYKPLSESEQQKCLRVVHEQAKADLLTPLELTIQFEEINARIQTLFLRTAGNSEKIEELVKNAILQKWVEQGKQLHQDNKKKCAFCGNVITESRWEQLEKHFDTEFSELKNALQQQQEEIQTTLQKVCDSYDLNKSQFYSSLYPEIDEFNASWIPLKTSILTYLKQLNEQIETKKEKLFEAILIGETKDFSSELAKIYKLLVVIIEKHNNHTASLTEEKQQAQKTLRYNEIYSFLQTINYTQELDNIAKLKAAKDAKEEELKTINSIISEKENEIESLKKHINDEKKGAEKVNEYLTGFFGHHYLSLSAVKEDNDEHYRFKILRSGKIAYHLSEGECSLVAFCYFMARLEDNLTKGKQPVIWIDDPISSLDANHIFFVYSLIKDKIICCASSYQQLFISTHNLHFLKYLKRLSTKDNNQMFYLTISRHDAYSEIAPMPKYLKEYITEFNYLFKQIYDCANLSSINNQNYTIYYNFGNNARKFLEIYLYYKYPTKEEDHEKYIKFFGSEDKIPAILIERINNEYSHLAGIFERGETPIEVPEMKKAAQFILQKIEEKDKDQFDALVESIRI